MALSPQDAELLARIMGGPLSQLQGMTAPPQITPEMAFGAPTMPGGFAPAGDVRSIPQAAFGPMPEAMRAVPSPQAPRGGAFVPLVPGQGAAPQPYGGPDTPLARANFGGPPAPAPAPAMAAYGPMGGAAPGSAAFSPLPQAADRLSAIPPEQMPGGNMLGKVPMPEELAGYTVGLGPGGPVVSGGPVQSAVATNDSPTPQMSGGGGLGGLGGFFGGLFDPSTSRGEDFQNMMLGWAAGAGGTWQDSLAGGAKLVAAGRLSRKEKDELAKSTNKTAEWALANGADPGTVEMFLANKDAKGLISYVEERKKGAKRDTTTIDGKLVDTQTGEVIGDYGSNGADYVVVGNKLVNKNDPTDVRDYSDPRTNPPTVRQIKQPDGSEVAVQWNPQTEMWDPIKAPQGGAAVRGSPKLTEGQSKDVGFYNRGRDALARLEQNEKALLGVTDAISGSVPIVGNSMISKDRQVADQAAREFLAVILRKDTGAAVTPQEFETYAQIYIPKVGDSPEVLAQKRQARETAMESIRLGLGNVGDQVFGPSAAPAITAPAATNNDPLGLRN